MNTPDRLETPAVIENGFDLSGFNSKIDIEFERGPYLVRTARGRRELVDTLKLRYRIFYGELLDQHSEGRLDVDEFDFNCDHLIIIDKSSSRIVGTYRLNCSLFSNSFYSAKEFGLQKFLAIPGTKLELGRACIDSEFRNGTVLSLLWRGITEYIQKSKAQYLLGCASVFNDDPKQVAKLMHYFYKTDAIENNYSIRPTAKYKMLNLMSEFWSQRSQSIDANEIRAMVPPLLQRYIKFGAKVCPVPAWDEEFNCVDFLTILDTANLNSNIKI